MALKYPAPLNDNEWDSLMKQLNEQPNKEKVKMLKKAIENGSRIKTHL